jgi:hypothetical protein
VVSLLAAASGARHLSRFHDRPPAFEARTMRPGLPGGSRLLTRGSQLVAVVLSLTQCAREAPAPTVPLARGAVSVAAPLVNPAADPVIAAAGDLVCGSTTPTTRPCQHAAVAALVPTIAPDAVLLLGDIQYEDGTLADFNARFHPVWGTTPAPTRRELVVDEARL